MSVNGEFDRSLSSLLGFLRETGERVRASDKDPSAIERTDLAITNLQRELEEARATRAGDLSMGAENALEAVSIESGGRDLHLSHPDARRYAELADHLAAISSALLGRPAPLPPE